MKFVIGSGSKRKVDIAFKVINQSFPTGDIHVESFSAKSQMPETPWDKQTFDGARNRALDSRANITEADYYIGLESGLIERYDTWGTYSGGAISREISLEEALRKQAEECGFITCKVSPIETLFERGS